MNYTKTAVLNKPFLDHVDLLPRIVRELFRSHIGRANYMNKKIVSCDATMKEDDTSYTLTVTTEIEDK